MKKLISATIALLFCLFFFSCNDDIPGPLMSADEILTYMNENFEGTFTFSEEKEPVEYFNQIDVFMDCLLPDNSTIEVTTLFYYLKDIFGCVSKTASFVTDYYPVRYKNEINEFLCNDIAEYFDDFNTEPGFKIFTNDTYSYSLPCSYKFSSVESFYNKIKCDMTNDLHLVFFCSKENSSEISIRYNAFIYDSNIDEPGNLYAFKHLNIYFAEEYKDNPDDLTLDIILNL